MRNLAKGGVVLTLLILLVGIFYYQKKVEAVTLVAGVSQQVTIQEDQIRQNIQEVNQTQEIQDKNKKDAVKKEESQDVEKQEVKITVENEEGVADKGRSFRATAYCLRGKTASGSSVRRGIVAADPRVLPLGTHISLDAGKYSGTYVVADTGGAVKGNKIDIWVPSCSEARTFGRRTVKVRVNGKRKR